MGLWSQAHFVRSRSPPPTPPASAPSARPFRTAAFPSERPPRGPCGVLEGDVLQGREGSDAGGEGAGAGVAELIDSAMCVCVW